jgi:hypothetical protein
VDSTVRGGGSEWVRVSLPPARLIYEPTPPPCAVSRWIGRTATIEAGRAPPLAGPIPVPGSAVGFWALGPFSFQPSNKPSRRVELSSRAAGRASAAPRSWAEPRVRSRTTWAARGPQGRASHHRLRRLFWTDLAIGLSFVFYLRISVFCI